MFPSLYRYLAVLFSATIINAAVPSPQNVTLTGEALLSALKTLGLLEYGNITEAFLATPQGKEYLTQLAIGSHIIFVVDQPAGILTFQDVPIGKLIACYKL